MKAIILLSGGLDSATCLAVAKSQGYDCYALSFDYGQKHCAELNAAKRIATAFSVKQHVVITLSIGNLGGSALTDKQIDVPDYVESSSVPITYVPARNTTFLSIALGWAEIINAEAIFIGVNAVDYSGYPDCRPEYIAAFQHLANLATKAGLEGRPIHIETPLVTLQKSDIITLGISLGVDYHLTVSCYRATDDGKACGQCDSCTYRKKGFDEAGIADQTRYA
jgi:7-cyano-7-deazaguanine synthase